MGTRSISSKFSSRISPRSPQTSMNFFKIKKNDKMFLKKEEARQLLCILKLTLERWSSVATLITATLLRHSTNSTRFYRQREQQQRGNLTLRQWPSFFLLFWRIEFDRQLDREVSGSLHIIGRRRRHQSIFHSLISCHQYAEEWKPETPVG